MQRSVPDIGDIARKQRPDLAPVGAVAVQHLAGVRLVLAGPVALRQAGPY